MMTDVFTVFEPVISQMILWKIVTVAKHIC